MAELTALKAAASLNDLATLLRLKPAALAFVLYKIPDQNKYTTFTLRKKNGGERIISAPNSRLKLVQRRLGKLLDKCQLEVETRLKVKRQCILAHGFKPGLSIQTNALNHRGRRWVFNADLQDFFPSINFGRVYGFFMKNQYYMLNKKVATVIAQIACHQNKLPQGSPCSPVISNIIAHLLDIRLNELAASHGCTYSRYVDDLTFSTNEHAFPSSIGKQDPANAHHWHAGSALTKCVARAGFSINAQKTRLQYCDSRQEATGLVINKKVNVKREYYKLARSMCWQLVTTGTAFEKASGVKVAISRNKLRGMMAFIYHVKKWDDERRKVPVEETEKSCFYRVYADFLNYISFYGQTRPTIVCEGKTDNVYLACALRSLALDYPTLVKVNGVNKALLVQLFRFTKTAEAVQHLSGGASQLSNLLSNYRSMTKKFKGVPIHPTILVVDNDSGPEKLFKHLSNLLKKQVDGSGQYYFVYQNLYVVAVPKVGGAFTAMEQLFEPELLKTKLDGKTLDLTNKEVNGRKFYSKNQFAIEIIQKKRDAINFDGFKPLLDAIAAVQTDYAIRVAAAAGAAMIVPSAPEAVVP
jgi:RNA-directed DNA polymerase